MKRFKLTAVTFKEFSAVRKPAHEGALAAIVKSADDLIFVETSAPATPDAACPSCGAKSANKSAHCASCGAKMTKELKPMKTEAEIAALETSNADLTARLAKSEKFGLLNDVERTHYGRLSHDAQAAFLAKSATERAEETKPVFTSASGVVFTKADDQRLVDMAKSTDADRVAYKAELEKAQGATWLAKAESILGHLPGCVETRAALLKDVAGISDEKRRTETMELLTKADELAKGAFQRQGAGSTKAIARGGSAEQRLEIAVKKFAEDNKISVLKAWEQFSETPEGGALYKQVEDEKKGASA